MAEGARLESVYTVTYREFESLTLRNLFGFNWAFLFFEGIAYLLIRFNQPTVKYKKNKCLYQF